MAGIIVGAGEYADKPFVCSDDGTRLYSAEEMCYYLYNNAENITGSFFSAEFVRFVKEELKLDELFVVLNRLIIERVPVRVLIAAVLSVSDYYTPGDITELSKSLEYIERLSPGQKMKRQADYLLKCGAYKEAKTVYMAAIADNGAATITTQEYGEILHNLAVLDVFAGDVHAAAEKFSEAFERNKNIESLKQYMCALKLCSEELTESEKGIYADFREIERKIEEDIQAAEAEFAKSRQNEEISRLKESMERGKHLAAKKQFENIIKELRSNYRAECV